MMKEFFLYIYASFSGGPLHYQYALRNIQWEHAVSSFNYFAAQLTTDDNILVSVAEDDILVQEFYDSGIRVRGSSMPVNSEVWTAINKSDTGVVITIDIWRAGEARIFTNIFMFLWLLTAVLCLLVTYYWLAGYSDANPLPLLVATCGLTLAVALQWLIARTKYTSVKKGINNIITG